MIAVATAVLFSITALAVGLVLLDGGLKFINAAKGLRRDAKAAALSGTKQNPAASLNAGMVTALRLRSVQPAAMHVRAIRNQNIWPSKVNQQHAAA